MPSSFSSFSNGDIIEVSYLTEIHNAIQDVERGASLYAGLSSGTSTAYEVTLDPEPDDPYGDGMVVHFK
ncbi:MAG: hypothetical protein KIS61_37495, partial [Candidatus Eremiobacteraeota bacterium]|nr:hypothetical protein [Candidatus Eremiobacteraeota bacterium]